MRERLKRQRLGLSATATHDTKRGEDARARIYAISEMPEEWAGGVGYWNEILGRYRGEADGGAVPEREMEWLFYQALLGVWPADLDPADEEGVEAVAERVDAFMLKAAREAKFRTSWTSPAADFERALSGFVRGALSDKTFLRDFADPIEPLILAGAVNSLSQLAIKLTAPGIPDFYYGTEFWDLSLVDPDNRRPVDFSARDVALQDAGRAGPEALLTDWRSGAIKLRLMQAGLYLRKNQPELFIEGDYVPLEVTGEAAEHAVAFARRYGSTWLFTVATRFPLALLNGRTTPLAPPERWANTRVVLPTAAANEGWHDMIFGGALAGGDAIRVADALSRFPVAILCNERAVPPRR
jgi:(1->4)-alpha-D-glucan 1-alpha-D-glucosylmutase